MSGRLPAWLRTSLRTNHEFVRVTQTLKSHALHTVCSSAKCPNRHECWNAGTATFMIMGDVCTRNCSYCAVASGNVTAIDHDEPLQVATAAADMNLRYVVVTSVTRDDLADGGATVFANTIQAIRNTLPHAEIEVLTPDFGGNQAALDVVLSEQPEVLNHNLETVRRLQKSIRKGASYDRSLELLRQAVLHDGPSVVKSGLMVGLGETDDELREAIEDLAATGCQILTLGQYISPSAAHTPTDRFVPPEKFELWRQEALCLGFKAVASAPLVRSSYQARELYKIAKS